MMPTRTSVINMAKALRDVREPESARERGDDGPGRCRIDDVRRAAPAGHPARCPSSDTTRAHTHWYLVNPPPKQTKKRTRAARRGAVGLQV